MSLLAGRMTSNGGCRRQRVDIVGVARMQRLVRRLRAVHTLREGVALDGPAILDVRAAPHRMYPVGLGGCETGGGGAGRNSRCQHGPRNACNRKAAPYNATQPVSVHGAAIP